MFTSGGSEGNNMVFSYGMKCMLEKAGKKHVVISQIEHDSVYESATHMFASTGKANIKDDFYTHFIHTKQDGTIDVKHLEELLNTDESIGLVSVMYVNNETGAVNPINHIGEMCKERGILFHTDCVQAAGCHAIDTNLIGCDYATISGHKIYAPKGIGAIYVRDKSMARSLIYGGSNQEFGLRGGTENVASIVGLGKACDIICSDFGAQRVTVSLLKRLFYENVISGLKEYGIDERVHVNGASVGDVGKTLNLRIEDIDSETLLLMLDAKGVCISAGSACHSHKSDPSRVLTSMGLSDDEARDSVRISFSSMNTPVEVEEAALRTVYEILTGKTLEKLEFTQVRGLEGIREAALEINGKEIRVAIVHGLKNVEGILEQIKAGRSPYHFIEVMACEGGCIGGGGNAPKTMAKVRKRQRAIYEEDRKLPIRKSHENIYVKKLYEEYLGEPLGEKSHHLLHTTYHSRRDLLR